MARWLYKLGSWSARRAWAVLLIWAVLLGTVATSALSLSQPFTSKMTIPGTEFQNVIDDLQDALPKAAGGSGTVVFSTTDGKQFTAAQKKAIAAVVAEWKATDGIQTAVNPFTTQAKLDKAKTDVADATVDLADGKKKIAKNTTKLADAKDEIADGRQTVATNLQKLGKGEAALDAAQKKLDAGRKKLNAAARTIAANEKKLKAAQQQLTAGKAQLDAALAAQGLTEASVPTAQAKLEAGITQLKQQLSALIDQVGADDPQVVVLRQQLAGYQTQAKQLQTVLTKITQLQTGQKKVDAGVTALNKGKATLKAARVKLATGQATIDANRAKIATGKQKLATATTTLDEAAITVSDAQKRLAKGKQKLVDGQADLARGVRQLALTDGLRFVSSDGTVAVSSVQFTLPSDQVSKTTRAAIPAAGAALAAEGIEVDYSKEVTGSSFQFGTEAVGVAVAAVVLLVVLGSLLAAGLPLLTALVGVGVGLLGVLTVTYWVQMTEVTPILALMLGLAVGIDYALFLVNRHRHQLVEGAELIDSIARATGTAGSAVVVAGLTVITALAALTLTGIPFLGVMGLAAAATVAVAVLVSITLTPALLRFIGPRILSPKGRKKLAAKLAGQQHASATAERPIAALAPTRGTGWGGLVTRHPWIALGASVLLLAVLAIPAASLKLGLPDGGFEPQDSTAYRAYTLISDSFGAGENGTIIGVAKVPAAAAASLSSDELTDLKLDIAERLKQLPGVQYVVPATTSTDHQTLVFQIVPTTGPSDDATASLVTTLRSNRNSIVTDTGITSLGFAGQTVANIDISTLLAAALPGYLTVVVGISLILLLLVFRSLLVPLMATAGFLLSIAASFGGVVAVYQWGWFGSLFGVEHAGVILSFLPTLAIGILFGLAMDYQMFLVSGMREAWAHGEDPRSAVRSGFSHGARVITAAALIMTSVFASFMHSHMTMVRPIGFALAFGVLIDAFVVRMTIIPTLMHLLGAKAWYLPRWLDRILPDLDVEGTKLAPRVQPAPSAGTGRRHASTPASVLPDSAS
jgi:putative drug exporter of the RND superfamily